MRKLGDSNPRYEKFVRQFSKLLVSATHPNFLLLMVFRVPTHQFLNCECKDKDIFHITQEKSFLFWSLMFVNKSISFHARLHKR